MGSKVKGQDSRGTRGFRIGKGERTGSSKGWGWSDIRIHAVTFAVRLLTTDRKKPTEAAKWKAKEKRRELRETWEEKKDVQWMV